MKHNHVLKKPSEVSKRAVTYGTIDAFLDSLPREAWQAGEDVLCQRDPEAYFGITYRTSVNLYLVRQIVDAVLGEGGKAPRMHKQPFPSETVFPQ